MSHDHCAALDLYLDEIARVPALSREREADLALGVRRGRSGARNALVEANLGFVVSVAKGYRNLGLPFEDLVHEGNLGLIEAAERFDERRDVKFITYALWWIRRSILLALNAQPGVVRLPDSRLRRKRQERDTRRALRQELQREPEPEEVRRRLGRRSVDSAPADRARRELTLDLPAAGARLLDRLAHREPSAEDAVILDQMLQRLTGALDLLPTRTRRIVCRRFGLDGTRTQTLAEVAEFEGISRERTRQIEREALARLRRLLQQRHLSRKDATLRLVRGDAALPRNGDWTGPRLQAQPTQRTRERGDTRRAARASKVTQHPSSSSASAT
jgi:RNA polymerase primary sigma factor